MKLDGIDGKASLTETDRANRYILPMGDLFTKFGVAGPMPEQSGEPVADAGRWRWVFLFVPPVASSGNSEQTSNLQ